MHGSEAEIVERQKQTTLKKMRSRLVSTAQLDLELSKQKRIKVKVDRLGYSLQILSVSLLLIGIALSIHFKDQIAHSLGVSGISQLAEPQKFLSNDEKALYWTYALFQNDEFKKKFGETGSIINPSQGFQELKKLIPLVSSDTRMEITKYIPPGGLH